VTDSAQSLRSHIREVPDFPQPGILFFDLNPIYADAGLFDSLVWALHAELAKVIDLSTVDYVVAPDARGFIAGTRLAASLSCGFIATRKPEKLPPPVESVSYGLEYGENILELSSHMSLAGATVVVHDDVLATGGTAGAAAGLLHAAGAQVAAFSFSLEVAALSGADALPASVPVATVLSL
jgi:adenine phosphoribosyltransferase